MTRSIGAAAVLETAAETPPTVIGSQFLANVNFAVNSARSSISTEFDGDNDNRVLLEVDVLKKSITKGGLFTKGSA